MAPLITRGLLGTNLGRSRAKNLHELLGDLYGLDITYTPMDLVDRPTPVSIQQELARCRDSGFTGVNMTHPYKQEAFSCVKTMPHVPKGLTSVNTVRFKEGEMSADNTDYTGCCRSFINQFGSEFKPGRVVMLGAGGVGVAIACALRELKAEELTVFDVRKELAAQLVAQMRDGSMPIRLAETDLSKEIEQADGLVNATPIGMFHYPGNPFPPTGIKNQSWAFDAVYTPEHTEFISNCKEQGIRTLSGFHLFLYQGIDAFRHVTGIDAEKTEVETLFLRHFPLE